MGSGESKPVLVVSGSPEAVMSGSQETVLSVSPGTVVVIKSFHVTFFTEYLDSLEENVLFTLGLRRAFK